jgi:hypothetical protein
MMVQAPRTGDVVKVSPLAGRNLVGAARPVAEVTGAMQVLVVHAHPSRTSFSRSIADTAEATLKAAGHDVTVVHLDDEHFRPAMSAEERLAYDTATPILDAQVAVHADLVAAAEALVFVYPTWWAAPPAVLKGWMDRVLVPGVAFTFEPGTRGAGRSPPRAPPRGDHDLRVVAAVRARPGRSGPAHDHAGPAAPVCPPLPPHVARHVRHGHGHQRGPPGVPGPGGAADGPPVTRMSRR